VVTTLADEPAVAEVGMLESGTQADDGLLEVEPEPLSPDLPAEEFPPPELPALATPEPLLAARVLPVEPRPMPPTRRAIFFDVENTSRPEHIARVLSHLAIQWTARSTELFAVGNWRVVSHETARLLARHGGQLVHSAPSVGVRDWSDLRIAVGAGVWLAQARPGDSIEIVSDDQAFDAVGDVATSLGVTFRRLSYRALAGMLRDLPIEETHEDRAPRRRRRGSRRGGGRREPSHSSSHAAPSRSHAAPPRLPAPAAGGDAQSDEVHSAPPDEIVEVVRELVGGSDRGVSIDALSNALKARGFRRPPGSLRLITRLRRIKELDVSRNGTIRLVGGAAAEGVAESAGESAYAGGGVEEGAPAETSGEVPGEDAASSDEAGAAPAAPQRRRRRRGGRRRRGRGGGQAAVAAPS
jgi:hypothetical protein